MAADDARDIGPVDERDDEHHEPLARLDEAAEAAVAERAGRGQSDRQQQDRECQQHVDQAREDRVDPAAVEGGDHADGHADRDRDRGCEQRDLERYARAVEHAAEDRAPERVDAEEVCRAWAARGAEGIEVLGSLHVRATLAEDLHDQRRQDCHKDEEDDEDERRHRDLVLPEAAPEELERRARLDLLDPGPSFGKGRERLLAGPLEVDDARHFSATLRQLIPHAGK